MGKFERTVNEVTILGNLGADPEMKVGAMSGKAYCILRIATDFTYFQTEKTRTLWHEVTIRGEGLAKNCMEYLKKGKKVYVSGYLDQKFIKGVNGKERMPYVCAKRVIFLSPKKKEEKEEKRIKEKWDWVTDEMYENELKKIMDNQPDILEAFPDIRNPAIEKFNDIVLNGLAILHDKCTVCGGGLNKDDECDKCDERG
jgi:single stranded DNA-binding protein